MAVKFAQKVKPGRRELLIHIPSAYANMAASKYCKDPNYAKGSKGKKRTKKAKGGLVFKVRGQGRVMKERLR